MLIAMRFVVIFAVVLVVLALLNLYVGRRLAQIFQLGARGKVATLIVMVIGIAVYAMSRFVPEPAQIVMGKVGAGIEMAVLLGGVLSLVVDLGFLPFSLVAWRKRRLAREADPPMTAAPSTEGTTPLLTRRELIQQAASGAALAFATGASAYGVTLGRVDFRLEEVPVRIPGLPRALDGFTLVQLSDIHFGTFVGESEIREAVRLVRRARPDIVVLTGDLVDHDERFAPLLGELVTRLAGIPRHGVIAIPGNHDYYTGIEAVLSTLLRSGAHVLRNDGIELGDAGGKFALLGVDDVWANRDGLGHGADLDRAIAAVDPALARVLLCHNPVFFPDAADKVALQLSGHTHGGQVHIGIQPAEFVLPFGYVEGLYTRGESTLYVNRGFGTAGPPTRIGVPPEVTKIVLVAA